MTEFNLARKHGFIGVVGDIYIKMLSKRHGVVVEKNNSLWDCYAVTWKENGTIQKLINLLAQVPFQSALERAIKYVEWFNDEKNVRKVRNNN